MAARRAPFGARPAGRCSPFGFYRERTGVARKCISARKPNCERTRTWACPLCCPLLGDLPGNAVPLLPSLVEGAGLCHQWGSVRAREEEVWAIQEHSMSASPCGEALIFLGRLLKESTLILSRQGAGGEGGQAESTVMLLVHLISDACFPKPQGSKYLSTREGSREKALRSCTTPAPPSEVTTSQFSHLKSGDKATHLQAELGV